MGKRLRRWLYWGIGGTVLVLGFVYGFRPDPIPVDLARIERMPLQVTVDDEGVARIREVYVVSAPIAGRVMRSALKVGDKVEKDQTVVATIRPAAPSLLDERNRRAGEAGVKIAEAALTLAQANLVRAKAEREFSRAEKDRIERLAQRGIAPERQLEQVTSDLRSKDAAVSSADAEIVMRQREVEQARANLIEPTGPMEVRADCCVDVMAPITGQVLKIATESETVVAPGASLVELGQRGDLEIVVELLSSNAVRVKEGAQAFVEDWGGKTLQARVRRIEPAGFEKVSALGIEEQRVIVRLDLLDPREEWSRLGHEYRVFVRIVTWSAADALAVPLSALFRQGDDWAVFKVVDGRATLQRVVIGERNARYAAIRSGLAEGDRVIMHPNDRIAEGVAITERPGSRR